ncbi:MAG: GH25 family lysozyme [Ruthenibacterium sp.]
MKILDVSKYQPTVNYALAASAVDGVIIRAGLTYYGSQSMDKDDCFERHYAGFKAANLPVGAYYYSAADTVQKAKSEAVFFAALLRGKRFELPVFFDVENGERQGKLSKSALTAIVIAFCHEMESLGYFAGYYSYTSWLRSKLDTAALSKIALWKADYRADYDTTIACDMHQYTSSGNVAGIVGGVDLSNCTRDFTSAIRKNKLNGFTVDTIVSGSGSDGMLFDGRNQVPYGYGTYRYKRSGSLHRGIDVVGLDGNVIRSTVAGTVKRATHVAYSTGDLTWQWGYYVRVDDAQGNKYFFCHMQADSFAVKVGQKVAVGTPLGMMGNSGNAVYNNPPYKHVHYEVRTASDSYLDPCISAHISNRVGVYGSSSQLDVTDKLLHITGTNCEYFDTMGTARPLGMLGQNTLYEVTALSGADTVLTVGGVTIAGPWCKFKMANGGDYYCLALSDRAEIVNAPAEDKPAPVKTATADINIRTAPGTAFGKVELLAKGDSCIISEAHNNWGYITGKGWVCLDFIV